MRAVQPKGEVQMTKWVVQNGKMWSPTFGILMANNGCPECMKIHRFDIKIPKISWGGAQPPPKTKILAGRKTPLPTSHGAFDASIPVMWSPKMLTLYYVSRDTSRISVA